MASFTEGLGAKLCDLPIPQIQSQSESSHSTEIKNLRGIASYNWVADAKQPTMIVPGSPALWTPPEVPFKVARDSDDQFINQNAARTPQSPMAPILLAIQTLNPKFDFSAVDFILNRNDFLKLMSIVTGKFQREEEQIRIDLELLGKKTICLTRWEKWNSAQAGAGYGAEFLKRTTSDSPSWEDRKVEGSHRIVTFELGGFKFIERFVVDATYPERNQPRRRAQRLSFEGLDQALSSVQWGTARTAPTSTDESTGITIVKSGELTDQANLIEIKTRSMLSDFHPDDAFFPLYISGTPTLIVARHNRGRFAVIHEHRSAQMEMKQELKENFERVSNLLAQLKEKVIEYGGNGQKLSFLCQEGKLGIYKREGGVEVPENLVKLFEK